MASSPSRMRRAWIVAAAALALIVTLVAAAEWAGWPFLREPIERRIASAAGVNVHIGTPFRLSLIGRPQLDAEALHVGAPSGIDVPFLLDAKHISIGWRWPDAWAFGRGDGLRLTKLHATALEAHLRRERDGRASWLLQSAGHRPAGAAAEPPRIDSVQLDSGVLHVNDALLELDFDATIRLNDSLQPQGPGLMTQAPAGEEPRAGFAIDAKGTWRRMPATASVRAPRVLPLFAGDAANVKLQTRVRATLHGGKLAFDGTLVDLLGSRALDGDVSVSGPSLALLRPLGVTLPDTPPFSLRGHVRRPDAVWQVDVAAASIGRSRLNGEFRFDPRGRVARLDGTLRGSRLALQDLGPAIGAPLELPPARSERARILPQKDLELPSLSRMNARVDFRLDELDLGTTALAPLRPLSAQLTLEDGVLTLAQIDTGAAGGRVTGSSQLDARVTPPRWTADLAWSGVDLARWVPGARAVSAPAPATASSATKERRQALAGEGPVRSYLTGQMQGEAHVKGEGRSTAQILATMNGTMRASIRDGTLSHLALELAGLDLAQALGLFIKGDDSLRLQCAAVAIDAKQGVLTPRTAVLDTHDSTVVVDGRVDLRDERLGLRAIVKPKDFTFVSLRTPLRLEGTLARPDVKIEKGRIVGRVAAAAALALVNPLAALLPFVDPGSGDPQVPPCAAEALRNAANEAQIKGRGAGKPSP